MAVTDQTNGNRIDYIVRSWGLDLGTSELAESIDLLRKAAVVMGFAESTANEEDYAGSETGDKAWSEPWDMKSYRPSDSETEDEEEPSCETKIETARAIIRKLEKGIEIRRATIAEFEERVERQRAKITELENEKARQEREGISAETLELSGGNGHIEHGSAEGEVAN